MVRELAFDMELEFIEEFPVELPPPGVRFVTFDGIVGLTFVSEFVM